MLKPYVTKGKIHFSLLGIIILSSCDETQSKEEDTPNVLFILVDGLGCHDLSYKGSQFNETPNIDRLAYIGTSFIEEYSNGSVCSPSRASLFTGQYPVTHGITDWIGTKTHKEWKDKDRYTKMLQLDYVHHLPHELITLPETFKTKDYKTFFVGKWHLGGKGSLPEDHGFDINIGGWESGSLAGGYFDPYTNLKLENRKATENLSCRLSRETISFIEKNKESKLSAYLSFYAVHTPLQTSKEKWMRYSDKAHKKGVDSISFEMERILPKRKYQGSPIYVRLVENMDETVGIVMDTLEENGLMDNTIIVFTSDHRGVVSGDAYNTSVSPLRDGKGYQWEDGIKVPYIVYLSDINHADIDTSPVTGADLYPKLLDYAGVIDENRNSIIEGNSLVSLLNQTGFEDRPLFWHYPHYSNQAGALSSIIQKKDWKLIYYHEDKRTELYHIYDYLGEKSDLNNKYPNKVSELKKKLLTWLIEKGSLFYVQNPDYDASRYQEKLNDYRTKLKEWVVENRRKELDEQFSPNQI